MATEIRVWGWLVFAVIVGWLLFLLAPVLTPFLAAFLLAYLGDPLIDRLQRFKMSRTLAVSAVFATLVFLLLLLVFFLDPLIEGQLASLQRRLPVLVDIVKTKILPWMRDHLGIDPAQYDLDALRQQVSGHLSVIGGFATGIFSSITQSSLTLFSWLANLVLIPVVTFYLLRDWDQLIEKIDHLLPRRLEPRLALLAKESDEVLGAFLKGQLIVMLALGTIYSVGLFVVGLDFALLIGMMAGLVSFVPYLGFVVGILVAGIAVLLQFQDAFYLIPVIVVFGIGQIFEGVVLTPIFVGDRIGLHPVAVIFAVLAGGQLFGFFGILLALPVAAVIMVLLRHAHDEYLKSVFYE